MTGDDSLDLRAIQARASAILDRDLPALQDYIARLEAIVRDLAMASRTGYTDVRRCALCGRLTLHVGGDLSHEPGCPITLARDLFPQ